MVKKKLIKIGMISIILFIIFVLALCLGTTVITPRHLIKILIGDRQSVSARILIYVRLPRVLATLLVGAAFAVSGVIVQSVLNNSLAAPNIIGVNAGGGLGTVLWMAFMPYQINYLPFAAFIGAFLAVILVYFISNSIGISRMTLILSGIAISSLLNAMSDTVITFFPDALAGLSAFKVGGVSGISFARIQPLWLYVVGGII
jgi:iron complex transport system permease protein